MNSITDFAIGIYVSKDRDKDGKAGSDHTNNNGLYSAPAKNISDNSKELWVISDEPVTQFVADPVRVDLRARDRDVLKANDLIVRTKANAVENKEKAPKYIASTIESEAIRWYASNDPEAGSTAFQSVIDGAEDVAMTQKNDLDALWKNVDYSFQGTVRENHAIWNNVQRLYTLFRTKTTIDSELATQYGREARSKVSHTQSGERYGTTSMCQIRDSQARKGRQN